MKKYIDFKNKIESKVTTLNSTEVVKTAEKTINCKFEWTPKCKAAFEKCVAARKNQIEPKPKQ
jgi:hypothetical protein